LPKQFQKGKKERKLFSKIRALLAVKGQKEDKLARKDKFGKKAKMSTKHRMKFSLKI